MSVVDRVLDALNAHDIDAFVACYAPEATIEDGHDHVVARGQDELRERYGTMFDSLPNVRVEALSRIEVGEFVVQEELVTGRGDPVRHVAVYLVRDDLVARERLVS
jgi:putative hydrolase of HD superfamily